MVSFYTAFFLIDGFPAHNVIPELRRPVSPDSQDIQTTCVFEFKEFGIYLCQFPGVILISCMSRI